MVSVSKFDFDKWWNSTHKGSSPEDMVARLDSQKAWLAVSELYEAEYNSEYKSPSAQSCNGCIHQGQYHLSECEECQRAAPDKYTIA